MRRSLERTRFLDELDEAEQRLVVLRTEARADLVAGRGAHERDDEARRARLLVRHAAGRVALAEELPALAHHPQHVRHGLRARHAQVLRANTRNRVADREIEQYTWGWSR